MKKYKDTEEQVLEKLICNCCGKEIPLHKCLPLKGVLQVRLVWGYGSGKDGMMDTFDLCEDCYDRLTAEFQIPPVREEVTEFL